jgi:hypothetical protein
VLTESGVDTRGEEKRGEEGRGMERKEMAIPEQKTIFFFKPSTDEITKGCSHLNH